MSTATELGPGTRLASYTVESVLGRGAMSVVYEAHDARLGRRVALKVLALSRDGAAPLRERFLRESRLAASVDHPNVIPIYEAGQEGDVFYIAMRLVRGTDLRELLAREGPLPPERALALAAQVAEALDAAHARGLLHRDVKPANILLSSEDGTGDHVYLSDFGLAVPGGGTMTAEANGFHGTAEYAAPEQIEGHPEPRSDLYSLACVLFECLTGEPPFCDRRLLALLWAHVNDEPPRLSERRAGSPPAADAALAAGLRKPPDERPETCAAFVASVRRAFEPDGPRASGRDAAFRPPGPRRTGRHRRRWIVLAALVAGAVGAAGIYSTTPDESSLGTAQNPITIFVPWLDGDPEHRAFVEVLRAFEQTTGLETETVHAGDTRIVPGYRPTLGFTPSPGQLAELVRDGTARPFAELGLTDAILEQALGRSWIGLGTVDGQVYGLPLAATSKSLVWYRPRDFRRLGVQAPRTWDELVAVTRRLAGDGRKPWALGGSDSWTLTDWLENVYIRTEGPWKYDSLFAGKLPFDDPSVLAALERMATVLNEKHLAQGVDGALAMTFLDAVTAVFGADRGADLLLEGGFVGSFALALDPAPVPGTTIAATPVPPIDSSVGSPIVVGGDFIVAFDDDPAVRRLLLYLMSSAAGRIWVSHGTVVSPNKRVPLSAYPNELVRTAARQATTAQVIRFDGSDLLPSVLAEELGRTLQEVIRHPGAAPELMKKFQQKAERVFNT